MDKTIKILHALAEAIDGNDDLKTKAAKIMTAFEVSAEHQEKVQQDLAVAESVADLLKKVAAALAQKTEPPSVPLDEEITKEESVDATK